MACMQLEKEVMRYSQTFGSRSCNSKVLVLEAHYINSSLLPMAFFPNSVINMDANSARSGKSGIYHDETHFRLLFTQHVI